MDVHIFLICMYLIPSCVCGATRREVVYTLPEGAKLVLNPSVSATWWKITDGADQLVDVDVSNRNVDKYGRLQILLKNFEETGTYKIQIYDTSKSLGWDAHIFHTIKIDKRNKAQEKITALSGSNIYLKCGISGTDSRIKWTKDEDVEGDYGSNRVLTIKNAQISDAGHYVCFSGDIGQGFNLVVIDEGGLGDSDPLDHVPQQVVDYQYYAHPALVVFLFIQFIAIGGITAKYVHHLRTHACKCRTGVPTSVPSGHDGAIPIHPVNSEHSTETVILVQSHAVGDIKIECPLDGNYILLDNVEYVNQSTIGDLEGWMITQVHPTSGHTLINFKLNREFWERKGSKVKLYAGGGQSDYNWYGPGSEGKYYTNKKWSTDKNVVTLLLDNDGKEQARHSRQAKKIQK